MRRFSVYEERMIGSDSLIGEFRMPLRQVDSYELTHYHVYMEKKATVSWVDSLASESLPS